MVRNLFCGALFLFFFGILGARAQQLTVSGTVKDAETGQALPGVTIAVKGTTTGTSTNSAGAFQLSVPDAKDTLKVSYIGYQTKEVAVNGRGTINIELQSQSLKINELVVTGYQTKQKGELTGAISQIDGSEISKSPTPNLTRNLEGRLPGLKINDRGGEPGSANMNILIRGQETFGENAPLVIVDGIPSSTSQLANLSSDNIASVSVLKDASAAIYGARAANGVIVVTTKRGKKGQSSITIDANTGVSTFTILPKMMSAYQNAKYQSEMETRYGRVLTYSEEDLELFKNGSQPLTHPNTNWYDVTLRKYAPQSQASITAQGGKDNVQYFVAGNYNHKGSLFHGGDMYYDRYQLRSNIDAQIMKYLKIGFDLSGELRHAHQTSMDQEALFHRVQLSRPMDVAVYPNGLPGRAAVGYNPVIGATDEAGWNDTKEKLFTSRLSLDLNLDWITDGLSLTGIGSFNENIIGNKVFDNIWDLYSYNVQTGQYDPSVGTVNEGQTFSTLTQYNLERQQKFLNVSLKYRKSFGDHNINAFVAYEVQEGGLDSLAGFRRDIISAQKPYLDLAGTTNQTTGGIAGNSGRVSYFGTVSYDYKRKYLLDFTIRRDGSFNFPKKGRFGTFPSVSAGWTISKEPFMSGSRSWLDNLKIRSSYGLMGNDQVPSFQYLTQYELSSNLGYYIFGDPPARYNGFLQTNTPNPDITWEVAKDFDVGIDAVLFNNKLTVTADYFYDKRRRILIKRSGGVPDYTGISLPQQNLGKINNHGFELHAGYQTRHNDWGYDFSGNISYNKNKVIFMSEPKGLPDYQKQTGHPIKSYLVYLSDGIFHDKADVEATKAKLDGTLPGDIKYKDVNGDGKIDGLDMVRVFSSPIPRVQYGVTAGVSYKNFNLSIFLQGQAQAKDYMSHERGGQSNLPEYYYTKRWTKDNPKGPYPRAFDRQDFYEIAHPSDFWLYNGAFMRLKNLSFSYGLPSNVLSKTGINSVNFYIRAYNLLTWEAMSRRMGGQYFDPELNGDTINGNEGSGKYYPQEKTVVVGVSIQL